MPRGSFWGTGKPEAKRRAGNGSVKNLAGKSKNLTGKSKNLTERSKKPEEVGE